MEREMFLNQTHKLPTPIEEPGEDGEEQDKAVGWPGGAQIDLPAFVIGMHGCAAHSALDSLCFVTAVTNTSPAKQASNA